MARIALEQNSVDLRNSFGIKKAHLNVLTGRTGVLMRTATLVAAAACFCTAASLAAQDHTNRFELTEQFIRDIWVHPIQAMDVTLLGPGPVHDETNDCELHIGAEMQHNPAISDFPNIVLEPPNVCKDGRQSS